MNDIDKIEKLRLVILDKISDVKKDLTQLLSIVGISLQEAFNEGVTSEKEDKVAKKPSDILMVGVDGDTEISNLEYHIPVTLSDEVHDYLTALADKKQILISDMYIKLNVRD